LSNLAKRVYEKNWQNPIAIIVLKLLFGDIDSFITGAASMNLIGDDIRAQASLATVEVDTEDFPLGVTEIRQDDITQAQTAVRSVLADVSGGLELFENDYTKPGVGYYSIATRHYLQEQRNGIPQVNIVALYPRLTWDPNSQEAFQELMNSVLEVGQNSGV
jgi:hypothetical protein